MAGRMVLLVEYGSAWLICSSACNVLVSWNSNFRMETYLGHCEMGG